MAAIAAGSAGQLALKINPQNTQTRLQNPIGNTSCGGATLLCSTSKHSKKRACLVRAAEPEREERNSGQTGSGDSALVSQEDLNYLVKLGAGSIVGAAAIKYGSVVFPEITKPNIVEALSIIAFPVVVAVVLLIGQSRSEQ